MHSNAHSNVWVSKTCINFEKRDWECLVSKWHCKLERMLEYRLNVVDCKFELKMALIYLQSADFK